MLLTPLSVKLLALLLERRRPRRLARRRPRRRRVVWALLLFVFACSHQSEEQKLIKAASPVKSWAASLAFAGELWVENRVPKSLIKNSVESAQKAIEKAREDVKQSKEITSALDELSDSASTLGAAVRNHDVKIATREVARCRGVYQKLKALEE